MNHLEIQIAVDEKNGTHENTMRRDFLLKRIENEIRAGFVFVSAARQALKQGQPETAEDSLAKAAETYRHASKEMAQTEVTRLRSVRHQLSDLCEAIDWLRFSHFESTQRK